MCFLSFEFSKVSSFFCFYVLQGFHVSHTFYVAERLHNFKVFMVSMVAMVSNALQQFLSSQRCILASVFQIDREKCSKMTDRLLTKLSVFQIDRLRFQNDRVSFVFHL